MAHLVLLLLLLLLLVLHFNFRLLLRHCGCVARIAARDLSHSITLSYKSRQVGAPPSRSQLVYTSGCSQFTPVPFRALWPHPLFALGLHAPLWSVRPLRWVQVVLLNHQASSDWDPLSSLLLL